MLIRLEASLTEPMTYASSGVNYDALDSFKRAAQEAARSSDSNLGHLGSGFCGVPASRGESAYLIETPDSYLAQVEEGLGTKNLVADAMKTLTGRSFYGAIAQDTVAMILNDLITLGALPLSVAMHLAVGDSTWFSDEQRNADLVAGWRRACDQARCIWGGGETPTLRGIVVPGTAVLSGSAIGIIKPKARLLMPERIEDGDQIVIFESSGIHANGLTLARKIADKLPEGYLTPVPGTKLTYGEALLAPTHLYVAMLAWCQENDIEVHYAVNITGHGWRKFMRPTQPFTYVIEHMPKPNPLFAFLLEHGPVAVEEAYANLNMGAGFALYMPQEAVRTMWARLHNVPEFDVFLAGYIEKSDKRRVVIRPLGLEWSGESLAVR